METKKLKDCERAEISMMYRQAADKLSQIKILSELYLISRAEVCRILKENGYYDKHIEKELSRPKCASTGTGWSIDEEDKLRALRKEKHSYKECARLMGRTKGSISSKIYELGI